MTLRQNPTEQVNAAFPGVHTGEPDCMCKPCRKALRHARRARKWAR